MAGRQNNWERQDNLMPNAVQGNELGGAYPQVFERVRDYLRIDL